VETVSYTFHGVTMNREMNKAQVQLGKLRLSQSEQRAIQSMMKQFEQARRRRVNNLMNAIAELQTGDLEAVIDLDTVAPMEEDGPSLLDPNEARNGRELAEILEGRLMTLLAVGEWGLCTEQRPRENGDLGGRMFVEPEETGSDHLQNAEAKAEPTKHSPMG
jgi:hypothetical protein